MARCSDRNMQRCVEGRYLKEKHGSEELQEIMKGKKCKEEGKKVSSIKGGK